MEESRKKNDGKQTLARLLRKNYGEDFNPVDKMAKHAVKIDEMIAKTIEENKEVDPLDRKIAVECWDKVAQYVQPKLKATEISGNLDTNVVKIIDLSGTPAKTTS